jgi:hypothetical protein
VAGWRLSGRREGGEFADGEVGCLGLAFTVAMQCDMIRRYLCSSFWISLFGVYRIPRYLDDAVLNAIHVPSRQCYQAVNGLVTFLDDEHIVLAASHLREYRIVWVQVWVRWHMMRNFPT